jgi:site-specific recombinase
MTNLTDLEAARIQLDRFLEEAGGPGLEALVSWLMAASPEASDGTNRRNERLANLATALDAHPESQRIVAGLRAAWGHHSAVRLIAEMGVPTHVTLMKEVTDRVVDRFVPRYEPEDDLFVIVERLQLGEADADWIEALTPQLLEPWRTVMALSDRALLDAAALLAIRAASTGLTRSLLLLQPDRPESSSPFFHLPGIVQAVIASPENVELREQWQTTHAACHEALREAHQRLDVKGVSADLIYRLEVLEAVLGRLDGIMRVISVRGAGPLLAAAIVRSGSRQRGVRALIRNSMKRLSRHVVEHTGKAGEHYVVRTRDEWNKAGRSAMGAGVITAVTAAAKFGVTGMPLSPFMTGIGLAIVYSVSFVLLQLFHFSLASKQPANTASALAAALDTRRDGDQEVELVASVTRSQTVVTMGNVVAAIPMAIVLVLIGWLLAGKPMLGPETATYAVKSLNPLRTATIPYAMVTGVFLWLSSLAAGWAANWNAHRGVAAAVASSARLRRAIGQQGAAGVARFIVGYVALGVLLGLVPVILQFIGIPVEVRHVTLHSAQLALGAWSLAGSTGIVWSDVAWGFAGVVATGICNFAVSFLLSLRLAMRARDVDGEQRSRIFEQIRQAFRQSPRRFLAAPRE